MGLENTERFTEPVYESIEPYDATVDCVAIYGLGPFEDKGVNTC